MLFIVLSLNIFLFAQFQDLQFDVLAIMRNNISKGVPVLEKYEGKSNIPVKDKDRQQIVEVTTEYLYERVQYPSPSLKERLAIAIIEAFPQLASKAAVQSGMPAHVHFYNPGGSAYSDMKLKGLRKSLLPRDQFKRKCPEKVVKKPKKKLKKATCLDPANGAEEFDEEEMETKVLKLPL